MNKSELVEALATKAELSKAAAGRAVDVLVEEIVTAVAKGDSVTLVGFGTFKSAARAPREARRGRDLRRRRARLARARTRKPARKSRSLQRRYRSSLRAPPSNRKSPAKPKRSKP